jgi:hypothetical protein
MGPIKTVGMVRFGYTDPGIPCHCICHYNDGVRHCAPCCDRCYRQYDQSIWSRKAVVNHLRDTDIIRERRSVPSSDLDTFRELLEEWLNKTNEANHE